MAKKLTLNYILVVITNIFCTCLDSGEQDPTMPVPDGKYTKLIAGKLVMTSIVNAPLLARTLKEICEMSKQSTENHRCCNKQPLLNIPLDHTLVGELHLMLHLEDILIGNLVWEFLDWNKYDHFDSKKRNSKRVTSIKPD